MEPSSAMCSAEGQAGQHKSLGRLPGKSWLGTGLRSLGGMYAGWKQPNEV